MNEDPIQTIQPVLNKLYASSIIAIGIFIGLILIAIWIRSKKANNNTSINEEKLYDYGLLWLGCAILCWVLAGIWSVLYDIIVSEENVFYHGVRSFISTFNNAFFLLSLPYFDHGPEKLNIIQNYKRWPLAVISFSILISTISIILILLKNPLEIYLIPEVIYSIFTILILGATLVITFYNRDFKLLIFFTCLSIGIMLFSQLPEVWPWLSIKLPMSGWIFHFLRLVSKTTIMTILLALAMSWLETEAKRSTSREMSIHITGIEKNKGVAIITIPPKINKEHVNFNQSPFEYLLKFLIRRITGEGLQSSWLNVKKDLHDPANIRRIINEIDCKVKPEILRTDLFENDFHGNYRIRIDSDNIEIDIEKLNEYPRYREIIKELRNHPRFKARFEKIK